MAVKSVLLVVGSIVASTRGARFIVRGFAGKNSASGQNYVEPRRCIYVYQVPQP